MSSNILTGDQSIGSEWKRCLQPSVGRANTRTCIDVRWHHWKMGGNSLYVSEEHGIRWWVWQRLWWKMSAVGDENWKTGTPHIGFGAEGVKSVNSRVAETKCLFCGMRELGRPKSLRTGLLCVWRTWADELDKSRGASRGAKIEGRDWMNRGTLQLGQKCKRRDL